MSNTFNEFMAILAGVADALLLGAPSSAVIGSVADEYNISIAEATSIYNSLRRNIGQDTEALNKLKEKRLNLEGLLQSYPELTMLSKHYAAKRGQLLDQESKLESKIKQQEVQADQKLAEIDNLQNRAGSLNFATATKRWLNTGDVK